MRQRLPASSTTNLGARLGFLVALAALFGWLHDHGRHLVDLRHRPEGRGPVVEARARSIVGDTGRTRSRRRCVRTSPDGWPTTDARRPRTIPSRGQAVADRPTTILTQDQAEVFKSRGRLRRSTDVFDRAASGYPMIGERRLLRLPPRPALRPGRRSQPVKPADHRGRASHRRHPSPTTTQPVRLGADGARPRRPAAPGGARSPSARS